MVHCGRLMTEG